MIGGSFENDEEVRAALTWLANASGDQQAFVARLSKAQEAYTTFTARPENRGIDPSLEMLGPDIVAAYFAQAKSLLDERRSYDLPLAAEIIPWIKQFGRALAYLREIPGAEERAARMLRAETVAPDSAMFELVTAANYGALGLVVGFIEETPGQGRTPDFRLSHPDLSNSIFVECKRLQRGQYGRVERSNHRKLFMEMEELVHARRLSVHLDVTYERELVEIPPSYLLDHLRSAVDSPIIAPMGYPWKDEFGSGLVNGSNLAAVSQDILRHGSLYCGPKLARLLARSDVVDHRYNLALGALPDDQDPRFIDDIYYGTVVTWKSIAAEAIEKKARHIKAKVGEADSQFTEHGIGILHVAMDMEIGCDSSDVRRALNIDAITTFQTVSGIAAIYVHYLVPRVSEKHLWLIDETVERFGLGSDPIPNMMVFPASNNVGNDLPAWKQDI